MDVLKFVTVSEDGIRHAIDMELSSRIFKKMPGLGFQTVQSLAGYVCVVVEPEAGAFVPAKGIPILPIKMGREKYECVIAPVPGCLQLDNGKVLDIDAQGDVRFATPGNARRMAEIVLVGFDGSTDETDDHVLWVTAPTEASEDSAVFLRRMSGDIQGRGLMPLIRDLQVVESSDFDSADFHLPQDMDALGKRIEALTLLSPLPGTVGFFAPDPSHKGKNPNIGYPEILVGRRLEVA